MIEALLHGELRNMTTRDIQKIVNEYLNDAYSHYTDEEIQFEYDHRI